MRGEINILKHMIFFIIFIVTTLGLFFMLVIPIYKDLKSSNITSTKSTKELKMVTKQEDEYKALFKETQSAKLNIIEAFDETYNEEKIKANLSKELIEPTITVIKSESFKEIFHKKLINIKAKIKSPAHLYRYFDSLDKNSYISEINYPINFLKEGDLIVVEFNLAIYYNKSQNQIANDKLEQKPEQDAPAS
jgi:hypothetical protein